ncbi:MAG: phosphodiester glycosidase family protein [Oligoflexia bacterium]|nr:phosphodiester glycosidase family protein [Oligoflexia bacterium]
MGTLTNPYSSYLAFLCRRAVLTCAALAALSSAAWADSWRTLGADLELLQRGSQSASLFSSQLSFFRTRLVDFEARIIRARDFGKQRMSVASLCKLAHAALCINASFFDENGEPLGLIIQRGIKIQPMQKGGSLLTAVLAFNRTEVEIASRQDFVVGATLEGIQAGPRLISKGKPVSGIKDQARSRRSIACIDERRRLVLMITSSNFGGLTFPELQTELLHSDIGCVDAINLDGGGSSQLFLDADIPHANDGLEELSIVGRDEVPVALALLPKLSHNEN